MDEQLLIRFLTQKCTAEELREIEQWIGANPENANWLFEMEGIWSLKNEIYFSEEKEIREAYNRFIAQKTEARIYPRISQKKILSWFGYVAAILIIAFLGTNLYKLQKEAEIVAQSMNVIEVPKGQRSAITLTDGTKVWLNAESRLVYPASFTPNNRIVTLQGEGFFEVAHNEESPFIVRTDLIHVTVLGTKFNVEAYPEEAVFVTLAEGKVEVSSFENDERIMLEPNDQAIYSPETGMNLKRNIDTDILKTWTIGELSYVNKTLAYIVNDLQRRFNVKIIILDKELEDECFNSRVYGTATIKKVLDFLKETRRLDYRKNEDQFEIFKYKNDMPMK